MDSHSFCPKSAAYSTNIPHKRQKAERLSSFRSDPIAVISPVSRNKNCDFLNAEPGIAYTSAFVLCGLLYGWVFVFRSFRSLGVRHKQFIFYSWNLETLCMKDFYQRLECFNVYGSKMLRHCFGCISLWRLYGRDGIIIMSTSALSCWANSQNLTIPRNFKLMLTKHFLAQINLWILNGISDFLDNHLWIQNIWRKHLKHEYIS